MAPAYVSVNDLPPLRVLRATLAAHQKRCTGVELTASTESAKAAGTQRTPTILRPQGAM